MNLGFATSMSRELRHEVESQLLRDLAHYGVETEGLSIDWSDTCPEGHCTEYLGGRLENWSGVGVLNTSSRCVASGWLEFVHGGSDNPLFVFWEYLDADGSEGKQKKGIPKHVWDLLPERSKDLCGVEGRYDAAWTMDPLVVEWRRKRRGITIE